MDRSKLPADYIVNLLGFVLERALTHLLKHGLERQFLAEKIVTSRVRGKIDLNSSIKQGLIVGRTLACTVPVFEYDTPANRVIRETLHSLVAQRELTKDVRAGLVGMLRRFEHVPRSKSVSADLRRVHVHRNNRVYRLAITICRFWWEGWLAKDAEGAHYFQAFEQSETRMRMLFEKFIRNFYAVKLPHLTVGSTQSRWQTTGGTAQDIDQLPRLKTDIVIASQTYRWLIDTKYTRSVREYQDKMRAKEGHLYQLFAYAMNITADPRFSDVPLAATLLYPSIEQEEDIEVEIMHTPISVRIVDLSQDWQDIEARLLALHDYESNRAINTTQAVA